jgi:galactose mutarotase-like enzyme
MLKNQRSLLGNRVITTPCCHGFARESPFELAGVSTTDRAEIVYRLISDPATRRYYPFDFVFEMTYALRHTGLSVTFNVANADRCPIYLSFGWHPGFNTELGLGGKRHDWRIVLPKGTYRKYHVVNGEFSLLTGTTSDVVFDGPIPWTDDGLEQTLIFEIEDARNRKCRLHNSILDLGVDLTFEDFPLLGIWGKRDQDYICIEPWQGMDDHEAQESFDQKIGIYRLAPGETVRKSCTVTPLLT